MSKVIFKGEINGEQFTDADLYSKKLTEIIKSGKSYSCSSSVSTLPDETTCNCDKKCDCNCDKKCNCKNKINIEPGISEFLDSLTGSSAGDNVKMDDFYSRLHNCLNDAMKDSFNYNEYIDDAKLICKNLVENKDKTRYAIESIDEKINNHQIKIDSLKQKIAAFEDQISNLKAEIDKGNKNISILNLILDNINNIDCNYSEFITNIANDRAEESQKQQHEETYDLQSGIEKLLNIIFS